MLVAARSLVQLRDHACRLAADATVRSHLGHSSTEDTEDAKLSMLFRALFAAFPEGDNQGDNQQQHSTAADNKRIKTRNAYTAALRDLYAAQKAVANPGGPTYPVNLADAEVAVLRCDARIYLMPARLIA